MYSFSPLVNGLAVDHIAGYAFGGLRPHSPNEHVLNPNVLAIHTMKVKYNRKVYYTCTKKV